MSFHLKEKLPSQVSIGNLKVALQTFKKVWSQAKFLTVGRVFAKAGSHGSDNNNLDTTQDLRLQD